jgi:lipooligosaccharide transport system permease protein
VPPWARVTAYWLTAYRRTWRGSVFSDFLSPLLFLAGMGFGLGRLVDDGSAGGVGGVPYAVFVAPGVLAAQAMQTAVGESTFSVMGAIKWNRQYHAMVAAPLRVGDVVTGHLAFVLLRVVTTSVIFLGVAAALGALRSPEALLAVPVAVLLGMAFAAPVYAVAARSETDQPFNLLFRFVVTPLFLFSGTFFPVTQLPHVLQWVAWATPLWHAVQACRALALGTAQLLPVLGHVAYLLLFVAVGLVLAHRALRSRMVV